MSEIRANTVSNAAGTGPVTLTGQSANKVWASYNQVTPAVTESFNVSSLTDRTTGDVFINLTNSMATSTYYSNGCASNVGTNTSANISVITVNGWYGAPQNTTSVIQVYSSYVSAGTNRTQYDGDYVTVEANGDLA